MDLREARRYSRQLPSMVYDGDYFPFTGGLNLVDTALTVRPGQMMACKNYEPATRGGYERIRGFERFDGRLKPSAAAYYILKFDAGVPAQYPFPGDTVTGISSGATGVVLAPPVHDGGAGYLVIGRLNEFVFADNEGLQGTGSQFGIANGTAVINNADSDTLDATYKALAIADARALIQQVPGSGPIRGVVVYKGNVYAFRDNANGDAGVMWKSSAAGFVEVDLGYLLRFDAGLTEPLVGETVTGTGSSATATILRVVVTSGDWLTHDAAGYLITDEPTDDFDDNEELTTATGAMTADGTQAANALPPAGRYEFRVENFYGHNSTLRLYGVNGVGKAFEFQDSPQFFCPLETGMTVDTPTHLAIHKNQLWLSFKGGSVQKSGVGDPANWLVVSGAFELGVGDEVVGFLEEVGGILFVFSRNSTRYISGNSADGYAMDNFTFETGAFEWTIQRLGKGIYLDDRGITTLSAAQEYGNFNAANISELIAPLLEHLKLMVTASVVSRTYNRVRYFFSDNRIITVGFTGNKITGFTTSDYGLVVRCAFSGEDSSGNELLVFGSDTGYVYEADKGTSFDGQPIQHFTRLVFHHSKSPSRIKRYRMAHIDVITTGPTTLKATVDYSYADPTASGEPIKDVTLKGGGGFWDVSNWNEFRWSTGVVATAAMKLEGSGYNIGLLFSGESATEESHRLSGVTLHLSQRRLNRST